VVIPLNTGPYVPGNDPYLVEWLKADGTVLSNANGVTSWVANKGQNANQSTNSLEPLLVANAKNGLPAIYFNSASNQYFRTPAFSTPLSQAYTVFVVYKLIASPSMPSFVFDGADANSRAALISGTPTPNMLGVFSGNNPVSTGIVTNAGWNIAEFSANGP